MKTKILKAILVILSLFVILNIGYYGYTIYKINQHYAAIYNTPREVGLRKFPYPYKAALSISNDIDNTSTFNEFLEIQEFLNTKNETSMGPGVGLEIGNSFFMFDSLKRNDFSYFSKTPQDKIVIQKFIEAGYLDCVHSWGEGYQNRNDAVLALNEFKKHNFKLNVWINHSFARSNFGRWFNTNYGDDKNLEYYHADLTIPAGIKFVWLGSSTYIIGQDVPIGFDTFLDNYDPQFPFKSMKNIIRAFSKHYISIYGLLDYKYALHAKNELVKEVRLDDGQKVYEFMRYDHHPDGIGKGANSKGVAHNLSQRVLDRLMKINGYAIYYTHLGKNKDCDQVIAREAQLALRNLETQYRTGQIYVTTTYKLLNYYLVFHHLNWTYNLVEDKLLIYIHAVDDPIFGQYVPTETDLQGITFYIPSGKKVDIFIKDKIISEIIYNPADENKKESVTIPFIKLKYPEIDSLNTTKM
ncbi:hypothetical protein JW964_11960 [candidate division KSB1 bacterium]|nr:hypothetical protein [candidate division KSB1 bacterium]